MKKYSVYFLILSLVINFSLGAYIIKILNGQEPIAKAFTEIKNGGTYGPKSAEVIERDLTIRSYAVSG